MGRVWVGLGVRLAWVLGGLAVLWVLDWAGGQLNLYYLQVLLLASINVLLAASLNLINGVAGQFSLGHAGFMAIGGYVAGALTVYGGGWAARVGLGDGALLFGATLAGGAAAAVAGLLVGLPTLRLRGDYLAIATLGFGEIVRVVIANLEVVGGPRGFQVAKLTTPFWVWAWLAGGLVILRGLVDSTHGRAWLAIREDEVAAEGMGIPVVRYKVVAFMIGGFFAGVGGALLGHWIEYLNMNMFGFMRSVEIVVMVVLGGLGSLPGVCLAAVVLTLLPELLRGVGEYRMILYSILLIVMMLVRPQGLFGVRVRRL